MVNQKLISLKIDLKELDRLDHLCERLDLKRNYVINLGISHVIDAFLANMSYFEYIKVVSSDLFSLSESICGKKNACISKS